MGEAPVPADDELIERAREGDIGAFNQLVERYQAGLFNLCLRLVGDRETAEDATQEAFLSAYRSLARFAGGNVRSWLYRIAANQCKDELRRRKRRGPTGSLDRIFDQLESQVEVEDEGESAADLVERLETGAALQQALLALPFEQRQAIVLVDVYGFSYDEVAKLAGASTGTVKSRIHRGRERLRGLVRSQPELFGVSERLSPRQG
jgi:RNA polymerase sigma-70 factor (ECF subfamily)